MGGNEGNETFVWPSLSMGPSSQGKDQGGQLA